MARLRVSMRWWLALTFAVVAAVTAVAVGVLIYERSESAFRNRSTDLAVGSAVAAADGAATAFAEGDLERIQLIAERRRLALFLFDGDGRLLTPARSRALDLNDVPNRTQALQAALDDRRFVLSLNDGRATVIALPIVSSRVTPLGGADGESAGKPAAMLAFASRPELTAEIGILRSEVVEAALLAVAIGALVGLFIAWLITRRLRRVAAAAAGIELGQFDRPLRLRFRDELGALAASIDRMRIRLRESFERLALERDRLSRLLERLDEGVLTVDRDLRVEFVNSSARRLLGVSRLAEGDSLPDPWPDVSLRRLSSRLFIEGAPVAHARVSLDEDRTLTIVGLPAGRGNDAAVLVIADVSERERRERAEREFVTNAAHELRNPLAAITSAVEVLQAGAKEVPEDRDHFLGHIERESARLGRLTRALLVLARAQTRAEPPRIEPVEIRPLLETIAGTLTPPDGVRVEIRAPGRLSVLADPDLLEQALANLAGNAVRHTERGRISLVARPDGDALVAIEVRDTGAGIPAEAQERIFDRFYRGDRNDREGFGLGLAIVNQAVRALGGTIELASVKDEGTVVRVLLPAAEARAA